MKLNRKVSIILGLSAFAVVLASLGAVHSQQGGEEATLKSQLAATQGKVTAVQTGPLTAQQAALQQQLDQALKDLGQAKEMFSKSSDSVLTTSGIFRVAQQSGVTIQEILSSGATSQTLEGITYTVLPVEIKVTGAVSSLITFVALLNQEMGTGVIQTAVINVPHSEPTVAAVSDTGADSAPIDVPTSPPESVRLAPSTVDIQMAIYTYRGS